jgi:hypothetical protein
MTVFFPEILCPSFEITIKSSSEEKDSTMSYFLPAFLSFPFSFLGEGG